MKKYNKPEIETLALDTIDVIAISGPQAAAEQLQQMSGWTDNYSDVQVKVYDESLKNTYTW